MKKKLTLGAEPRIRSSKMDEISADLLLQETWYLREAIPVAGYLI